MSSRGFVQMCELVDCGGALIRLWFGEYMLVRRFRNKLVLVWRFRNKLQWNLVTVRIFGHSIKPHYIKFRII